MIFGVPKWVQKGELISVVGGHGAPWAPKSVLGPESCISRPPKVTPRSDNRLKKGAKVAEKLVPNLARRTARSGLNNMKDNAYSLLNTELPLEIGFVHDLYSQFKSSKF